MQILSEPRQKELQICQASWQRMDTHPSMQQHRREMIEAFGFYDGTTQWTPEDLSVLASRGQLPMVLNLIQGKIDSLSGAEIQSRIRSACRNHSGDPRMDKLAVALSHVLFFVQEHERMPSKDSTKFRHMLIGGTGWSNLYHENGMIYYENVHPYNMLPDMDDLSDNFEFMKFVGRKRWLSPDMVKSIWPASAKYIDYDPEYFMNDQSAVSPEIMDRTSISTGYGDYATADQSRILVCEIQRKQPKKAYSSLDKNGFYFETFDEEKAEEMSHSKSDITEINSNRIIRTYFINNFLLETGPLDPDIPGRRDFSYVPCVWKRRFSSGVPFGLLDAMKDVQRDVNVRQTKGIYLQNSKLMIVTGELNPGQDALQMEDSLKSSDRVITLPKGTEHKIHDNVGLSESQLKMYDKYDIILQRITGIFDDFQGKQTNTTSGVALKQRQMSSMRNNVFAFDNFSEMKQREAKLILSMIQGGEYVNLLSQIVSEEESEAIILNMVREVKGKKYIFNDVRTLPVSLYIEEIPDFSSTVEEDDFMLQQILNNPNAPMILSSPQLLKRLKIRDPEKLSSEFKEALANQGQPGGAAPPGAANSSGMPSGPENIAYPNLG